MKSNCSIVSFLLKTTNPFTETGRLAWSFDLAQIPHIDFFISAVGSEGKKGWEAAKSKIVALSQGRRICDPFPRP
jgi:hypothetical protein